VIVPSPFLAAKVHSESSTIIRARASSIVNPCPAFGNDKVAWLNRIPRDVTLSISIDVVRGMYFKADAWLSHCSDDAEI
jgi:hypothetical protein